MGTCSCKSPTTTNICNSNIGDSDGGKGTQNFCSVAGTFGVLARENICSQMGADGEWGFNPLESTLLNTCIFSSCATTSQCDGPCASNGCFGVPGEQAVCRRYKFNGDPGICCLQDYNCQKTNDNACFSDSAKKHTCSNGKNFTSNHRDATSPDCKEAIFSYCTGEDLPEGSIEWFERWTSGQCIRGIDRNMFNDYIDADHATCFNPPPRVAGSPCNTTNLGVKTEGFFWSQSLVHRVLQKYQSLGYTLGASPGQKGYSYLQDYIYQNICCPYPGLCQGGLASACSSATLDQVKTNPSLANWCGCHLPQEQYQEYFDTYGIAATCTPTCNRSSSLPIVGVNEMPIACDQNVCIIDDVTVNLISSTGTGNVNFAQVCGGCQPGQCSCTIGNASATLVNDTFNNTNIDYVSACGSVNQLVKNNYNFGTSSLVTSTSSTGADDLAQIQSKQRSYQKWLNLFILGILILLIVAVVLVIWFLSPRKKKSNIESNIDNTVNSNVESNVNSNVESNVNSNIESNGDSSSDPNNSIDSTKVDNSVVEPSSFSYNIIPDEFSSSDPVVYVS